MLGDDAGRITDDGTICRLDDESFYVTTTSSGADAVESWFAWWLAEWDLDVHLTDVSQGLVGVQPRRAHARGRSWPGSPISTARTSRSPTSTASAPTSAGVPCLLLRIGFVGELGYELHCPAALGRAPVGRD